MHTLSKGLLGFVVPTRCATSRGELMGQFGKPARRGTVVVQVKIPACAREGAPQSWSRDVSEANDGKETERGRKESMVI